jgi:hypothetical protein
MILAPLFLFFAAPPAETADSIMARVAENQDRAQKMRSAFIYHQNVLVRMNHTNGKLAHEEMADYTVMPAEHGMKRERTAFTGKYMEHGKVVEYHEPGQHSDHIHVEIDGSVCDSLADDFANNKDTKDGIEKDLFPLTASEQKHYIFHLTGTEDYRGIQVYRVMFEPKKDDDGNEDPWEGEALIDQKEFQPVLVTTHLSFKMPMAVRVVLGTNIEHVGFKVTYKKFDENVWFPVTYGGEFKVRALFFWARRVGISMQNSDFHKADVTSKVDFSPVQ